ncbi:MAG: NADP-dependent malic enzyme [Bacteroidetes bacterium]|nr:NADP-dependent malic enzyme [Bacteroidota bacterium]MBL6943345.1 NADP-dependent malic enzyme [Bacteroidales bacterium]
MDKLFRKDALNYHALGRPGKIEVVPTKPYSTQRDLSLAYSPGVADPCLAIYENKDDVYKYTAKGNLVAVISNGTAVLGLGDIGPEAGKPVMEGKGLLFKIFADIDVFDIEVDEKDIDKFIAVVKAIAPTFGGINLEDIKAPECFEIETRLKEELNIPIMHDDQHGTAIITSAGLLNALEIVGKNIEDIKIVVNGAGASAVSCTRLYIALGAKPENIVMLDSRGVLHVDRTDLNETKKQFLTDRPVRTLAEAIKDSDVFLGLSVGGVMKKEMLLSMAAKPIVFALANPTPEIAYDEAVAIRSDMIMATGRSDFPNQINNVLGFPFIFRGALDVRATEINEEMKLAASKALAQLAKEPIPEEVNIAFNIQNLTFGREYIIPKPTDPRLIERVAPAVAKAAMDSGVAKKPITNWDSYIEELQKRMGLSNKLKMQMKSACKHSPKRVVLADAQQYNMLKAAEIVWNEKLAVPVLLGDEKVIRKMIKDHELELNGIEIIDNKSDAEKPRRKEFAKILFEKQQRNGMTPISAHDTMLHRNYFAPMLVETGYADAVLSGLTRNYPDSIKPFLQIIGKKESNRIVSGMYIVNTKDGPLFLADCTVNQTPCEQDLVDITLLSAEEIKKFNIEPRIAMLSFSNFGSINSVSTECQRKAVEILHKDYPELIVDGEMQASVALDTELMMNNFPFSKLGGKKANTLIFPNLAAANISQKLLQETGNLEVIGPILTGMKKSAHVLRMGSSVKEIVDMIMVAGMNAE